MSNRNSKTIKTLALAGTLAIGMVLAGCGQGGDDQNGAQSDSGQSTQGANSSMTQGSPSGQGSMNQPGSAGGMSQPGNAGGMSQPDDTGMPSGQAGGDVGSGGQQPNGAAGETDSGAQNQ